MTQTREEIEKFVSGLGKFIEESNVDFYGRDELCDAYNAIRQLLKETEPKTVEVDEVIKFLLGEGTLEGYSFGEFPDNGEKYKRRYWWRKHLREAWQTRAALPKETGWRPIETMPADRAVIVTDGQKVVCYSSGYMPWNEGKSLIFLEKPTHWQPLPQPPKGE